MHSPAAPDLGELVRLAVRRTGRATLVTTGTSMLPTIEPGTRVAIERRDFDAVGPGEVVAFISRTGPGGSTVVAHRVAERDADRLLTIGDGMPLFDPPVGPADYLGVVPAEPAPPRPDLRRHGPVRPSRLVLWCARPPGRGGPAAALRALGVRVPPPPGPAWDPRAGAPAGALLIGLSAAGGLPPDALPALLAGAPGDCHVLLGFRFGSAGDVLPPASVDRHVRLAAPGRELPVEDGLRVLAGVLRESAGGAR